MTIQGTNSSETLTGTTGSDIFDALGGNDVMEGIGGRDTFYGGSGDDTMLSNDARSTFDGGSGYDTADFSSANNIEFTSGSLVDFTDVEEIIGPSNRTLNINLGLFDSALKTVTSGSSPDSYTFGSSSAGFNLNAGSGTDSIFLGALSNIDFNMSNGSLSSSTGSSSAIGFENAWGSNTDDTITGTSAANRIYGEAGGDELYGGGGSDTIEGSLGDDVIYAGAGSDRVYGEEDDDHIFGVSGSNSLYGGTGDDTIEGGTGADYIEPGAGVDSVAAGNGNDIVVVTVDGTIGNTTLDGEGGTDTLEFQRGVDVYYDGVGIAEYQQYDHDFDGFERLVLSPGRDTVTLDDGFDTIEMGGGNDILRLTDLALGLFGSSSFNIDGGAGADTIEFFGGSSYDLGSGQIFSDPDLIATNFETVIGGSDFDIIHGDGSSESLSGKAGDDLLYGGDGLDTLSGGEGSDSLYGGAGRDRIVYSDSPSGVMIDLTAGTASGGDATGDSIHDVEDVVGSAHDDMLRAISTGSALDGGAGNDTIVGGAGADSIDGGSGDDDTADYSGSTARVTVFLNGAAGINGDAQGDTLTNVENLIGTNFNDFLGGTAGSNSLGGGDSQDILDGQDGGVADTLNGGDGIDTAYYFGAAGNQVLDMSDHTNLANNQGEHVNDTWISIEGFYGANGFTNDLTGDNVANYLLGGSLGDTISGLDGADHLYGQAGNDTIMGGNGNDVLLAGAGTDTVTGGADLDIFYILQGNETDIITDWTETDDFFFFFQVTGVSSYSDLSFTDIGADVRISSATNTTFEIIVQNRELSDLNDQTHFVFG